MDTIYSPELKAHLTLNDGKRVRHMSDALPGRTARAWPGRSR